MNAAIHLPIISLHPSKLAGRTKLEHATHVLTNTELSMYGKNIFPTTRWDEYLNDHHILPDYQPFEYLTAGGYMGEIVRLIIVEAVRTTGIFAGVLPSSLATPYVLDTRTLALIETDSSPGLADAIELLRHNPPSAHKPTFADASFVQQTIRCVSSRSIAYFSTGIHALASLLQELEIKAGFRDEMDYISLGCDGSVINKYPGYMDRAQEILDQMISSSSEDGGGGGKRVILEKTKNSAVLGAGVAAALAAARVADY